MIITNNPSALRSQRELTDALLVLMKKYPYNEITVKQIILEAKLARKTFYRNFQSKDDVLYSLIKSKLTDYFDIVNNARSDVLTAIFAFADQNRELLMLLDKNDMLHIPLMFMNKYGTMIRRRYLSEKNPFTPLFIGLNEEYLISMNTGAIWNVIALWVHRGMNDDPEDVRYTIEQYLNRLGDCRT